MRTEVAIVGGGLSGLYAAFLLQKRGVDCIVFEARPRLGGRILSLAATVPATPDERFDLGPAWFWPELQPRMHRFVSDFGLVVFPQYSDGATLVERTGNEPPQRHTQGIMAEPPSMRLLGGMQTLIDAVAALLPKRSIRLNAQVRHIAWSGDEEMEINITGHDAVPVRAKKVILALPPRLVGECIAFTPGLPDAVMRGLRAIPTWMAGHAKALAVYRQPFWREGGLSGHVSSVVGPLVELHDASAPTGRPALFGFLGVPAQARQVLGAEALRRAVVAQLARLFGPEAANPAHLFFVDWAQEPQTATPGDRTPLNGHPLYGAPAGTERLWNGRLILAGTEASAEHGGYLEGALDAAEQAAMRV